MTEAVVEQKTEVEEIRSLTAHDRCDQCVSQAYVLVVGLAGELLFCAHHFTSIEKNAEAYHKLQSFAFVISDQRDQVPSGRPGE